MWKILSLVVLLRIQLVISTPPINETFLFGSGIRTQGGSRLKHQFTLANLLISLSTQASKSHFYNTSFGQLHGHYLCRGDVDPRACKNCVNYAKKIILDNRRFYNDESLWLDRCFVRYSYKPFSTKFDDEVSWSTIIYDTHNSTQQDNNIHFAQHLQGTMNGLVAQVSDEKRVISKNFVSRKVKINRFEYMYARGSVLGI